MCPPESFSAATSSVAHDWDTSFVPPSEISQSALKLASSHLGPAILNHSVRVYLYASALAKSSNSIYSTPEKHDLLFTACIMHDIGTCKAYDGPQRFEVEGGDAAAAHLRNFGVDEKDVHEVWVAIALHTSAGIAERIAELAKIVREAVLIDFGRGAGGFDVDVESLRKQFEEKYPRYEKVLGDSVVKQAVRRPQKAPAASWPGIMYRAHIAEPDWDGVNKAFPPPPSV